MYESVCFAQAALIIQFGGFMTPPLRFCNILSSYLWTNNYLRIHVHTFSLGRTCQEICQLACKTFWALYRFVIVFTKMDVTVLSINLHNSLCLFSPPLTADRLVSVYSAAADRDRSPVYVSWKDHSLYKGRDTGWRGEEGGFVTSSSAQWSSMLSRRAFSYISVIVCVISIIVQIRTRLVLSFMWLFFTMSHYCYMILDRL